jgi:hypothetical protein
MYIAVNSLPPRPCLTQGSKAFGDGDKKPAGEDGLDEV